MTVANNDWFRILFHTDFYIVAINYNVVFYEYSYNMKRYRINE